MHTMAALLADFILEENAYVNANLDDFTWGHDIQGMSDLRLPKWNEEA